jgi:hypothetical protein
MATFFSLNDGILSSASIYGYSMSGAEVTSNTTGVWLGTTDAYGPVFKGDGSTINAIAIHLSARVTNPTTSSLYLKLSSSSGIVTETYPVSSLTDYDDSNNPLTVYPQTWQILKLTSPYTLSNTASSKISLTTSTINTLAVMCSATQNNYNKAVLKDNTTSPISSDDIHIGGNLIGTSLQTRSITAATGIYNNLYIHKGSTLLFPLSTSTTLTLKGSAGLQITPEGTLIIGASSSPLLSTTSHIICLSGNQIDVHNAANLNIYSYPKLIAASRSDDNTPSSNQITNLIENISSTWSVGDYLIYIPGTQSKIWESATVASIPALDGSSLGTVETINTEHPGPLFKNITKGAINTTRNVTISGFSTTYKGCIRVIESGNANINYTSFKNFGIASTNKTGLGVGVNYNGNVLLSGCVFLGNNNNNLFALSGRSLINTNVSDNIFVNTNGLTLSSISANNFTFANNFVLSSLQPTGLSLINLSGNNYNISNNTIVGSLSHGIYILNNVLTGTIGGLAYNYNTGNSKGLTVSGVNVATIVGGGTYSNKEGIYVDASLTNLSSVTFKNLSALNNTSVGFRVSGTSSRILSANILNSLILNINGLNSSNNNDAGFEAYNITGNLSSLTLNNNYVYGIKTSIGNGNTIIDGLTSIIDARGAILSTNNILILSGYNYGETSIRNSYLSSYSTSTALCLSLDSTRFTKFSLDNCVLSSTTNNPVRYLATRNLIEGSYLFNNTWFGTSYLGTGINNVYQPNTIKSKSFAFTNLNKVDKQHITHYTNGSISLDSTIFKDTAASERLTPTSTTSKLRSSSKYVALNKGEATLVKVYIRKSTNLNGSEYNGNPPRLMLKRNAALGVEDTVLATATNFVKEFQDFQGISPTVTDNGVLEFYVDCDGTQGWINIDTWSAI